MPTNIRVAAVQAEPRWLDLRAGVQQTIDLIETAAAGGAQLVAFPETFLPGYPWWLWLDEVSWGPGFFARYRTNSMTVGRTEFRRIADAARRQRIHVLLGFSERCGSSLYLSQCLIDDRGVLLGVRRKPELTQLERKIFCPGEPGEPHVFRTGLGRIGVQGGSEQLHLPPRRELERSGAQVHIVSWPGFIVARDVEWGVRVNNAATLWYAVVGQLHVVAACSVMDVAGSESRRGPEPVKQLVRGPGGHARIFGPGGRELAAPLGGHEEGLIYADIELDSSAESAA
ncbi:nitrilase-related carbon-nitrogen hydrolase [Nocardia huaxiensis]|uniref:Carbon-nitrogen hydrolase family protein n=1 Tax=Nocardia huaxiensis TaxID=2755382 RepID=A0A7D6VBY8_9NOCA|nr:nitrilase-related carbon-nitrogen hydrolase [Nocardia huaxiensis]QLY31894.1 carbon-nitrogen hydrolase family protein [Nocardia huaxiensis]UFS95461.1 carbon-nitrogen hydrolase family protein [Nocardia huaxiensis]